MLTAFVWNFYDTQQMTIELMYTAFWLLGLLFIFIAFRRFREQHEEQRKINRALFNSEARKAEIMNSTLDSIISIDQQGRIMEFNTAAERTFGYLREQVIGLDMADTIVPANLRQQYRAALKHHQSSISNESTFTKRIESIAIRADGTLFPIEIAITHNSIDQEIFFTACMRDITESKQLHSQLLYQTRHDRLTGLVNRYEFENILNDLLKSIKDDDHHALIYLDLDQFKVVNENCGHGAGDCLLQELSNILHSKVTRGDTFARLGGDEFALLLTHQSISEATQVAQQLLAEIDQYRFSWEEMIFSVGASMGVVSIGKNTLTIRDVLGHADALCYQAKEEGRNRICVYNEDDAVLANRRGEINLISKIHDAFENNSFMLYKQKIQPISNSDSSFEHFEILLRLKTRDESGKQIIVSAASYLIAAERYDLISTIDRWVITTLFDWFENNPERVKTLGLCSVNISGPSFSNSQFLDFLVEQLNTRNIPAYKLCFEITETAAVSSLNSATIFIETLRSLGCQFALDDFGSGMSSFAYLKNLPVDYLKIDGEFVRDIVTDKIDQAMVKSINDVGHVLDKKTIAEFVENDEILSILNGFGVDYAQGYGIEKPRPLEG